MIGTSEAVSGGEHVARDLARDVQLAGGPKPADPRADGAVGVTMFDLPGSSDLGVTVLLGRDQLQAAPSQSLLRIKSTDDKNYLGVVSAGPFAEPDGLRADSDILKAFATHRGDYLPPFHGRVQVTILGEELKDGSLTPPRLRPLPNSPVFVLNDAEAATVLTCGGDVRLGLAVGHAGVEVGAPSRSKNVFPRHTAVLGTTGGGKSNHALFRCGAAGHVGATPRGATGISNRSRSCPRRSAAFESGCRPSVG